MDINALHESARKGEIDSERKLFELLTVRFRYLATLRLRNSTEAEEVAQEALIVISKEYRKIAIETSFAAWAIKVLDYRILNRLRSKTKKKIESGIKPEDIPDRGSENPNPDLKRRLLDSLRKISDTNPRYARILNLHYQGYTTDEICERLGITPGNFYVILSRARSLLQICLKTGKVE